MINKDRALKLLKDYKEWKNDFNECIDSLDLCADDKLKKVICHSIRAYFLDFHILCEDYISITLKDMNKYRIDISAIEGMEIIRDNNRITDDFYQFYFVSRKFRNRLAHRYKMPLDEELIKNLKENMICIDELEQAIKELVK